jgi:preprotein translocase subunit YajC
MSRPLTTPEALMLAAFFVFLVIWGGFIYPAYYRRERRRHAERMETLRKTLRRGFPVE